MITNPIAVLIVLVAIEATILLMKKPLAKLYYYVPALVWMYFVPMVLTTLGVLPSSSVIYDSINAYVLPASLLLIMLSSNVKGISKIGFQSVFAMLVGSAGIILGSLLGYLLFRGYMPSDMWKALASLSASWIGGSANMMGVFQSFQAPSDYLSPIIIVDTVVAYVWLPLLIYLSRYQESFDRRNGVSREVMDFMHQRADEVKEGSARRMSLRSMIALILLAAVVVPSVMLISRFMPKFEGISSFVWVIIIVTAVGVMLSLTKLKNIGGSSTSGYLLLYLFLISVGAKSSLADIGATPAVFGFGIVTLSVHIVLLLLVIKLMKMPMFLFASSSMANIGGTASASVVGGVYNSSLVPISVIQSVMGYVVGTYGGLLVGAICGML
jgi:uncharacterized membrane protein